MVRRAIISGRGNIASPETAALVAGHLLDNALLAAGLLHDTKPTVDRMNALMAKVQGAG